MKRFWGFITPIFVIALVTGATTPQMASANDAISARVQELEQQIEQLKGALEDIKQQAAQPSPAVQDLSNRVTRVEHERPVTRVSHLEERIARVERVKKHRDTQVFFRGGYAEMIEGRSNQVFTDLFGVDLANPGANGFFNDGDTGYYFAAGIEHNMTRNLWGFRDGIELWAEIQFGWSRFSSNSETVDGNTRVVPGAAASLVLGGEPVFATETQVATAGTGKAIENLRGITMSQFTLTASPKIKFPGWYGVKPWIIPAGMAFHVISPPSNAGTVLAPGAMFAGGVEYDLTDFLTIGADGRYHFVADEIDGVDADGFTAGGYLGFKF